MFHSLSVPIMRWYYFFLYRLVPNWCYRSKLIVVITVKMKQTAISIRICFFFLSEITCQKKPFLFPVQRNCICYSCWLNRTQLAHVRSPQCISISTLIHLDLINSIVLERNTTWYPVASSCDSGRWCNVA